MQVLYIVHLLHCCVKTIVSIIKSLIADCLHLSDIVLAIIIESLDLGFEPQQICCAILSDVLDLGSV